jgi:hypothetical protein
MYVKRLPPSEQRKAMRDNGSQKMTPGLVDFLHRTKWRASSASAGSAIRLCLMTSSTSRAWKDRETLRKVNFFTAYPGLLLSANPEFFLKLRREAKSALGSGLAGCQRISRR